MPFKTFIINDVLGNVIEPFCALALGYIVGSYWDSFSNLLELIAATIAVAVIAFVLFRIRQRMLRRRKPV